MANLSRAAVIGNSERGICAIGSLCCPHLRGAKINSGCSNNVFIEGKQAAILNASGLCNIHGGTIKVVQGSASVFINGKPAARIKDRTQCQRCGLFGTVVEGVNTVFIGD